MVRLMWTAWTAVLLIACLSCRTDQGAGQLLDQSAQKRIAEAECIEYGLCPQCYVEIVDQKNAIVLRRCGDDAPGVCCDCVSPSGPCCECTHPGGELPSRPLRPGEEFLVRVGPDAVVKFKRQGQLKEHRGPMAFPMEDPLPMEVSCRKKDEAKESASR